MAIIYIIDVIMLLILIGWTWSNLGSIEKNKKVVFIILFLVIEAIVTLIAFNISKASIVYPKEEMISSVRNVLTLTFLPLNGLITMPFIAKQIERIEFDEITEKEYKTKMLIILVISIALFIFECNYLSSIQTGIVQIINSK